MHLLHRDLLRIGDNIPFLQLLRKGFIEQCGEVHVVGQARLGDGQPHGLLPADEVDISRAGRCLEIPCGGHPDALFAGRTARDVGGQPRGIGTGGSGFISGTGFGFVVHDREGPVGRCGERGRCGPFLEGIELVVGLFNGQIFRKGEGRNIDQIHLDAPGGGQREEGGQQVKTFHDGCFWSL